jgi:hypothetical protein
LALALYVKTDGDEYVGKILGRGALDGHIGADRAPPPAASVSAAT